MYQNTIKHNNITKHLQIYQITEGYCYNSDSLFLWDFILPHIKHNAKVLELGSGSGIIGLLCARDSRIKLYQIEKQAIYALMNAKNALINNIDSVIIHADCNEILDSNSILMQLNSNMLYNKEKLQSLIMQQASYTESFVNASYPKHDLKDYNITRLPYFDLIISNPPFYPPNTLSSQNPIKAQATQNQYMPLTTMLKLAKKILKPNAKFIFCYTPSMLGRILESLLSFGFGIEFLRFVYPRLEKDSTLVLICARLNSKAQTHILPPLITHDGISQKDNTKEVASIYKAAHTQSIKVLYNDIIWSNLL